jgi:hypothetical protein
VVVIEIDMSHSESLRIMYTGPWFLVHGRLNHLPVIISEATPVRVRSGVWQFPSMNPGCG